MSLPDLRRGSETRGCGGDFAFAIGGVRVGRQCEREVVIRPAGVDPDHTAAGEKVGAGFAQVGGNFDEGRFGIGEPQIDLVAKIEKRGADLDVIAEQSP